MPYRNKKPCNHPGCSELIEAGTTYCAIHEKEYISYSNRVYDNTTRDESIAKFYNSKSWKSVRNRKIKADPICEHCKEKGKIEIAKEVDHIIPIKVDWSKRLDINNLQSLCKSCHRKKTIKDKKNY